ETVEANQAVSEKDAVVAKDAELGGPEKVNPDVVQEAPADTTEKPETAIDDVGAAVLAQFQVAADAPAADVPAVAAAATPDVAPVSSDATAVAERSCDESLQVDRTLLTDAGQVENGAAKQDAPDAKVV